MVADGSKGELMTYTLHTGVVGVSVDLADGSHFGVVMSYVPMLGLCLLDDQTM